MGVTHWDNVQVYGLAWTLQSPVGNSAVGADTWRSTLVIIKGKACDQLAFHFAQMDF